MDDILFDLACLVQKVHEQPATRERACLLTKLDEARHWARDMKDREVPPSVEGEPLPPQYGVEHQ